MQTHDAFTTRSYAGLAADDLGGSDERPPIMLLHGLTFDRQMWRPALRELESIDPGRRVVAFDLPAHGESADIAPYSMQAIAERVHSAIVEAGLERPVVVGHSYSAGLVAMYATQFQTSGVIAVEGTLRVGDFAGMAQSVAPALRGPGFGDVWARIAAHEFRLDEVTPAVREVVEATSRPRQEIVLGYWQDLLERTPAELDAWILAGTATLRQTGVPYVALAGQDPTPAELASIRTHLPETRTLVWPGSGHFPQLAYPRRFAELLAETRTWVNPGIAAGAAR